MSDPQDEPIDGGTISGMTDVEFKQTRFRERTARTLAIILLAILGATILVQYLAVLFLLSKGQSSDVEQINRLFNSWLPVISGLVSSAVTYYFTKDKS